jgi:hypothetical protein
MAQYQLVQKRDDPNRGDKVLYESGDLLEIASFCETRVGRPPADQFGLDFNGDDLL